ncbi:hypothetical protein [Sporosarcina koreensis]|nr:hypothetical protein [Sporosarcina koreensis]
MFGNTEFDAGKFINIVLLLVFLLLLIFGSTKLDELISDVP